MGSTNAEALKLASEGEPGPAWVIAERQTAGKGRSGRLWQSASGNFYASLLLRPECAPADAAQLALVAGIAVFDALDDAADLRSAGLRLKWPNDILIGRAKLGGILVESLSGGETAGFVAVVGVGINLVSHPKIENRLVTHVGAHTTPPTPHALLHVLAVTMDKWLARWRDGEGFPTIREEWLSRAGPLGEALSVNAGDEVVTGSFAGLDATGALLLTDEAGRTRHFNWGDVDLVGAAPASDDGGGERDDWE